MGSRNKTCSLELKTHPQLEPFDSPNDIPEYNKNAGVFCDLCSKQIYSDYKVWHCSACGRDFCESCFVSPFANGKASEIGQVEPGIVYLKGVAERKDEKGEKRSLVHQLRKEYRKSVPWCGFFVTPEWIVTDYSTARYFYTVDVLLDSDQLIAGKVVLLEDFNDNAMVPIAMIQVPPQPDVFCFSFGDSNTMDIASEYRCFGVPMQMYGTLSTCRIAKMNFFATDSLSGLLFPDLALTCLQASPGDGGWVGSPLIDPVNFCVMGMIIDVPSRRTGCFDYITSSNFIKAVSDRIIYQKGIGHGVQLKIRPVNSVEGHKREVKVMKIKGEIEGLAPGYTIHKIGDQKVHTMLDVRLALFMQPLSSSLSLLVSAPKKSPVPIEVKVAGRYTQLPKKQKEETNDSYTELGVLLKHDPKTSGEMGEVNYVAPRTLADKLGLRPGDVIKAVVKMENNTKVAVAFSRRDTEIGSTMEFRVVVSVDQQEEFAPIAQEDKLV